jgi:hypothetical protein
MDDTYLDPTGFAGRAITLITGKENNVWHRDSLDRMYDWLRPSLPAAQRPNLTKHPLDGYAHQDLLWGKDAETDVYPLILKGLRRPIKGWSAAEDAALSDAD